MIRTARQKKLIERAYLTAEQLGLAVWCEDEAGPYHTLPQAGESWQPRQQAFRHPHEYHYTGSTKLLTLFHPRSGVVRVKGVRCTTNAVLHPWLKAELLAIVGALPAKEQQGALGILAGESEREVYAPKGLASIEDATHLG